MGNFKSNDNKQATYSVTSLGVLQDELLTYGYIKYCKLNTENIEIKNLAAIIMDYLSIKLFVLPQYLKTMHYNFNNPSIETINTYENKYKLSKSDIDAMDSQLYILLINKNNIIYAPKPEKKSSSIHQDFGFGGHPHGIGGIHHRPTMDSDTNIINNILQKYAHYKMKSDNNKCKHFIFDNNFKIDYNDKIESIEHGYNYISTTYSKRSLKKIGNNIQELSLENDDDPFISMFSAGSVINYFNYLKDTILLNLSKKLSNIRIKEIYHGCYTKSVYSQYATHKTDYEYIVISFKQDECSLNSFDEYIVWGGIVGWSNMSFQHP